MTLTSRDLIRDDIELSNVDWDLWGGMLLSEVVLARDWDLPEEDEPAWEELKQ